MRERAGLFMLRSPFPRGRPGVAHIILLPAGMGLVALVSSDQASLEVLVGCEMQGNCVASTPPRLSYSALAIPEFQGGLEVHVSPG